MKITAALIVKNEEEMLAAALDSVRGVDEIVVCDTGSEDNTVEVAKRYTDKVSTDYKWEDSFAKARNRVLSEVSEDTDWIVSIDADETIDFSIERLREILKDVKDEVFIDCTVVSTNGKTSNKFPRIFKFDPNVRWYGVAHNYLRDVKKRGTYRKAVKELRFVYGYSPAHKKDPDRTLRILSKAVEADPTLGRERFYLAREYYYRKQWEEAIKHYDEYIKVSKHLAEKNDAWVMRAYCLANLGRHSEACDSAWEALKYNANFKEALEFIGNHMDSVNKERWHSFSKLADNRNVLFVRGSTIAPEGDKPPMDLEPDGLFFFENLLKRYKKLDVLEWGSGHSTKYFPKFLQKEGIEYTWKAMEHHKGWYDYVKGFGTENVEVVFADKDSKEYLEPEGKYDVIYVDGRNRVECLKHAKKILKKGGFVLLHDAQRERYEEGFEGYDWRFIGSKAPKFWVGRLEKMETVPKIIHQIWIGPKEAPMEWIQTWKDMNPGFEHKLWTEKEIDKLGLVNRSAYDEYYKGGFFSGSSNVARVEILKKYGGIYIDADCECVTTLEDAPFMAWEYFVSSAVDDSKRLRNSPMGFVSNHEILDEYIARIGKVKNLNPSFKKTGPELLTKIIGENKENMLPAYAFLPVFHSGRKNEPSGLMYSKHYWGTTKERIGD